MFLAVVAAVATSVYSVILALQNNGGITQNMNFYNGLQIDGRPVDIWLTTKQNSVDDVNNFTHWTLDPLRPMGNDTLKLVPAPPNLTQSVKIPYGSFYNVSVAASGFAALNFRIRQNCDETTMICERGDVSIVPDLDYIPGTTTLKRGNVPFKPDIDTKVEFTFGCTETDLSKCMVNPSCVVNPSNCTYQDINHVTRDFTYFMTVANPGAYVDNDMLVHTSPTITVPLPQGLYLANVQSFDISNVDGYTYKANIYVVRPVLNVPEVKCYTSGVTPLDDQTVATPQLLLDMSTLNLEETGCPQNENVWPPPKTVPVGGDGYQTTSFTQLNYNYSIPGTFNSSFVPNSTIDLRMYRLPSQMNAAAAALNFAAFIGCASPCSILTAGGGAADTQLHPASSRWTGGSYLTNPAANPPATDPGIREVCCNPQGLTNGDTFNRCNTSLLWLANNVTPPNDNWSVGYYVLNYQPRPTDPHWYTPNVNPYFDPPNGSKYVSAINKNQGSDGPLAVKVYAYAHDDEYKSFKCAVVDPQNVDVAGTSYKSYKYLVAYGDTKPPI